ncbi:Caffeoyl-CoA O-methyltransferase [Rhynchospora pubera]|uniref:Caffeoyl-CoA O-methyltransferase n=1 Tax=Rhynchospora pubera TaxID=906938 RepID=A0AAV8CSG3_9POAL|nr:Caffeoyl-CoA O-methyltransferase [Rhynchospora pubera]
MAASDSKTLLKSDAVYKYILETSFYPREHECMRELRLRTAQHPRSMMASSPDETQFIGMLLKILNARNTLEIGVFTGYSLLATALALPSDGKIIAIDMNREYYEIGSPIIEKAGMAHKVDFREGSALAILNELVAEEKNEGNFDFAFIDADKVNFLNYHERVLKLLRIGGIIAYDNTLWSGFVVASPEEPLSERDRELAHATREFNKAIAADPRVEVSHLSIADGLTLCRRIA